MLLWTVLSCKSLHSVDVIYYAAILTGNFVGFSHLSICLSCMES